MPNPLQNLQAVLLHRRAYRETSYLVDFFTRDYGKLRAVCRGIRNSKNERKSLLQPFQPLIISVVGRHELKNLSQIDAAPGRYALQGKYLYCAMYLNELVNRAVPVEVPMEALFDSYMASLTELSAQQAIEPVLRNFELQLLDELGYGIDFTSDCQSGEPVAAGGSYTFVAEQGMQAVHGGMVKAHCFDGADLLKLAARQWDPSSLTAAKRLLRQALFPVLGDKPLKSRELFRTME